MSFDTFMLSVIQLERASSIPIYRQLYNSLREAVLTRQLEAGLKLPSTRDLAQVLCVSRNTVKGAYEQLMAEGYLEAQVGAGTFVTQKLPANLDTFTTPPVDSPHTRQISRLGTIMAPYAKPVSRSPRHKHNHIFETSLPNIYPFPFDVWARLTTKVLRTLPATIHTYGQPHQGYFPLREAIASYLRAARGVQCTPDQVIIVSGSQKALFLSAQALVNPEEAVWVEEPGYMGAKGAFSYRGAKLIPVPVDEEGLVVDAGIAQAPHARVVIVTPSHQFPLGYTMSLRRRLQLIQWAVQANAWIIEDDYDSEFRYSGAPLASLQGLDKHGCVIYVGTFSKVLFPSLRLGYLVVPPDMVDVFAGIKLVCDQQAPLISQAVLAAFMQEGHFTRHIRRMWKWYRQRRDWLLTALAQWLGDMVTVGPADCGVHVMVWLPAIVDGNRVATHLQKMGHTPTFVSNFMLGDAPPTGLLLSFGTAHQQDIQIGVAHLAEAIQQSAITR